MKGDFKNKLKLITDKNISQQQWSNFLNGNKYNTPFQSIEFYNFINSVPLLSARAFAIEKNSELMALCVVTIQKEKGIKGFFSKRAIIYGGPLITDNKEALYALLDGINKNVKGLVYTEIRNLNDYSKYKEHYELAGWNYQPYLNFHVDCTSEELVWLNFNNNRKRQIKKAINSGVTIEGAKSIKEVEEYYTILSSLYIKKVKKPLFSLDFFLLFFEKGIGKILLVKYENKIIGGSVCPILENKTIYVLYNCGLDQDYRGLSPSVMATYGAIEYGYKNNFVKFDFMGAGKPTEDYGVRDFKKEFGGQLVEHGRFIKINNILLFNVGKFALNLMQKVRK
jgi:serine/alanine adding enzyme